MLVSSDVWDLKWLIRVNYHRRGELEQSLLKAQAELESLKEQRSQQLKMTESIVRQRDMYRVLLAKATGVSFPQQGNSQDSSNIHWTHDNIPVESHRSTIQNMNVLLILYDVLRYYDSSMCLCLRCIP